VHVSSRAHRDQLSGQTKVVRSIIIHLKISDAVPVNVGPLCGHSQRTNETCR
jgi:hypothetical protein